MTDEKILNDHTEKIERLIGSLAALECRPVLVNDEQVKTEAQVPLNNNYSDFGKILCKLETFKEKEMLYFF